MRIDLSCQGRTRIYCKGRTPVEEPLEGIEDGMDEEIKVNNLTIPVTTLFAAP